MIREKIYVSGNSDPLQDVVNAGRAIRQAGWWGRTGIQEHWPLTTPEAADLLAKSGEFDIDADGLAALVQRRLVPAPGQGEAGHEWDALDVLHAARVLEWRGQWAPGSQAHAGKKSVWVRALEEARATGTVAALLENGDGPIYDVRHLLATLERADGREERTLLLCFLRATLEVDHATKI